MSKKGTKALASATLMSLVLTTALSAGPVKAAQGSVTRVGAADRYATAAQVATTNWTTSDNVVLVSGEGYADAVSASALAKKLDAPILLTTAGSLNSDTKAALNTLKAKNIYVVGGNASVSASVRAGLKANYNLVELGGANRYETNAAVAQKLVDLGVDPSNAIMVGGEGFSDALSVAPIAAAKGQILLLGMNDANYMKPVLDFVAKNKSNVTVVGTKNVISDAILNTVKGTRVDGGKDRWDTNQKVLANFKDTVKMDSLYVASAAYNAQDNGYADALVASALAGKKSAPLVLVDKDGNEGTANAIGYIKANATNKTDLNVVGGTGVVSEATVNAINDAVKEVVPPFSGTITSVEAVKDQYVNSKANDETLKFTVNGGTQVTAQDVVNAGYEIKFVITETKDLFETPISSDVYKSKDGILSKTKLANILTNNTDNFKFYVIISKSDQIIAQSSVEKVNIVNGEQTANSIADITVKEADTNDVNTTPSAVTTKVKNGKFIKGDWAQVTKVTGSINGSNSGVTITNTKFYSSDPFIAEVGENTGVIHTKNAGTFTLTVKSGSTSKDYTFTVTDDTERKVTSATASTSSIKVGKNSVNTFDLTIKDQFGDAIIATKQSSASAKDDFQLAADVKDGSTQIATVDSLDSKTDNDGKVTVKVTATADSGKGNLKVYNKNGVFFSIPVEVTGETSVDNIKVEAASNDSDSKDLNLDLNPKAADDNGDAYVKLNVNKYTYSGTSLGRLTNKDNSLSVTVTDNSDKKIIDDSDRNKAVVPDANGDIIVRISFSDEGTSTAGQTGASNIVTLRNNKNGAHTGTITVSAKYGDKTSSITLNVKDTTPSISGATLTDGIQTTFGTNLAITDVIKASKISAGTSIGDGVVRIAKDGTIFISRDGVSHTSAVVSGHSLVDDITSDSSIKYDQDADITLGKVVIAAKSGDIGNVTINSDGKFDIQVKSGATSPEGYVRIGIQRVHDDTPFVYKDIKVTQN